MEGTIVMKHILWSLCIGSVALAGTAWGQEVSNTKAKSGRATAVRASGNTRATATSTAHVSSRPANTRAYNMTPRTGSSAIGHRNNVRRTGAMTAREQNVLAANRQRNLKINNQSNVVNRTRNSDR